MAVKLSASAGLVKIQDLINNDAKRFEVVRDLRWPEASPYTQLQDLVVIFGFCG